MNTIKIAVIATVLAKFLLISFASTAQVPILPSPGIYPYKAGQTRAIVMNSTWRILGDQIIIEYEIDNPAQDTVTVHPVFRSRNRPAYRFAAKSMEGDIGPEVLTGRGNRIIWQYRSDNPLGFAKDEYYFFFDVASATASPQTPGSQTIRVPSGMALYSVVTRNQSFVIACPKAENTQGLLVVKGTAKPTQPGQLRKGDIILFTSYYSEDLVNESGVVLNNSADGLVSADGKSLEHEGESRIFKSCTPLADFLSTKLYSTTGGNMVLWIQRNEFIIHLSSKEGL